jgi:prevent-host-death family protein
MRIVSLAEVKAGLSAYVEQAKTDGPIVITRNGKAAAVLIAPEDDDDLETILLSRSRRYQALLERSEKNMQADKSPSEDSI